MVTDAADSDAGIQVLFHNFTVLNVKISVLVGFQPSEVIGVMVGKAAPEKDSLLLNLIHFEISIRPKTLLQSICV